MKLVTVKTFDDGISSHILKTRLESEVIKCYIHDENIVTLNPIYNFAVRGVKLKVDEPDIEFALKVLNKIAETPNTNEDQKVIKCLSVNQSNSILILINERSGRCFSSYHFFF